MCESRESAQGQRPVAQDEYQQARGNECGAEETGKPDLRMSGVQQLHYALHSGGVLP